MVLHLAGDNPDDGKSYKSDFPLPSQGKERIDVISMSKDEYHRCFLWSIAAPDAVLEMTLRGSYVFTLRAFCEAEPSPPTRYRIDVDVDNGQLNMTKL